MNKFVGQGAQRRTEKLSATSVKVNPASEREGQLFLVEYKNLRSSPELKRVGATPENFKFKFLVYHKSQ